MKHIIGNSYNRGISGGSGGRQNAKRKNRDKPTHHPSYPTADTYAERESTTSSTAPASTAQQLIVPRKFPQVGVLTNEILYRTPLSEFVYLEKTDGLHANLILTSTTIYTVRPPSTIESSVSLPRLTSPITGQTILDCELYGSKYYIFDCPKIEDVDISKLKFTERISKCSEWIDLHPELKSLFTVKQYSHLDESSLPSLIDLIYTKTTSPTTGNKIDGIIFQLISPEYFSKQYIVYKLKRAVLNTIDFKIFYNSDQDLFYLYLLGTYKHVIFNKKLLPRINNHSVEDTGVDVTLNNLPDSLYVLFSSPYFEDLHVFTPSDNWDKTLYFPDEQAVISSLMSDMKKRPNHYNGAIVEMSLNTTSRLDNYWVPMRVREDKTNSNFYDIGLSNCSVMFNPITKESIKDSNNYFTKSKLFFPDSITSPYHDINKLMRRYMLESLFAKHMTFKPHDPENPLTDWGISVLDLAGGRGADELTLYYLGARNIFAMDADRLALVQYVERSNKTPQLPYEPITSSTAPTIKPPHYLKRTILINAIQGFLGMDNSDIEEDIRARHECPKSGFDLILMNYAIHYIADSPDSLKELIRFVSSLLAPGGIFMFTCFDGDAITKIINEGGHIGPFTIAWSDERRKIAKMPLPTIDSSGYRSEPLVTSSALDIISSSATAHHMKHLSTFSPLDHIRSLTQYSLISDTENVSAFLSNIRCHIYGKV